MKNSFLKQVVVDLIRRVGMENLGDYTLVFPMQRAGIFVKQYLKDYLQQNGGRPMALPTFATIDSLSDSLSDLRAQDEVEAVFDLYRIYSEKMSATGKVLPVDAFLGWGKQLLTDFSSVDLALVKNTDNFVKNAAEANALDVVYLNEEEMERLRNLLGNAGEKESVKEYFTALWEVLPSIYTAFSDEQSKKGVGTRGARMRWVVEHFEEKALQDKLANRHFAFVGFNYLLEAERQLMKRIKGREKDQTFFYWDNDEHFALNNVYKFIADDINLFGDSLSKLEGGKEEQTIEAIACQSATAQAQYVNKWLREHHHEGEQTAIVVADEKLLQMVVYSLPEHLENKPNITKGYPLRDTRIYADTLALLQKERKNKMPLQVLEEVRNELEGIYKEEKRALNVDAEGQTDGRNMADSWQGVLLDEAYYQTQVVLRQMYLLLEKNQWIREQIGMDTYVLRNLLRRQLESVNIPFHGEPVTDIQVIGVLETRLLDFDNVLILNVEEGVVPNTGIDHSFLPFDLRRAYGMQTREEESKIYAYNFFRLLRRASHITLTFSEASTETGKTTMSRFLMQMLTSPAYKVERRRLVEGSVCADVMSGDMYKQEGDVNPNRLSPSSISDYIECPKEFYLKHIRRIYEAEEDTVVFAPNTFGSLVHATLEHLYMQKNEGKKDVDTHAALKDAYKDVNDIYLSHHKEISDAPYIEANHEAENYVIIELALSAMKTDEEFTTMENIWLEHQLMRTVKYEADGKKKSVSLKCVIDRLDHVVKHGKEYVRVLDYKTGGYNEDKLTFGEISELFTDSEKRYSLQTLIYSYMVRREELEGKLDGDSAKLKEWIHLPIQPEVLYPRSPKAERRLQRKDSSNRKSEKIPIADYSDLAAEFEQALQSKITEIMTTTKFEMTDEKTCEKAYCPFHQLCGRKEKRF